MNANVRSEFRPLYRRCRCSVAALLVCGATFWGNTAFAAIQCSGSELAWQWSEESFEPLATTLTPDNIHLIIGAGRDQSGVHDENAPAPRDAVIRVADWNTGEIVWSTLIDGDGAREVGAIATASNGDVWVAGQFGITPTAIGGYENEFGWIARLNSEGELLWELQLGEENALHGLDGIVPFPDGSVLVAGWTGVSSHESDDGSGWLARVTADGRVDWDIELPSSVVGVAADAEETAKAVLFDRDAMILSGHEIKVDGRLAPSWEHPVDREWWPASPISRGIGETINLRVVKSSAEPLAADTVSVLSVAEQGLLTWETSLELEWPWIVSAAGPDRELLVAPIEASRALSLVFLDADNGEHIAWDDPGLDGLIPTDIAGATDSFDIALVGLDRESNAGRVARITLNCE